MKLIGKSEFGFIVDMTEKELLILTAFREYGRVEFEVGQKLEVSKVYDALQALGAQKDDLDGVARRLRAIADNLSPPKVITAAETASAA